MAVVAIDSASPGGHRSPFTPRHAMLVVVFRLLSFHTAPPIFHGWRRPVRKKFNIRACMRPRWAGFRKLTSPSPPRGSRATPCHTCAHTHTVDGVRTRTALASLIISAASVAIRGLRLCHRPLRGTTLASVSAGCPSLPPPRTRCKPPSRHTSSRSSSRPLENGPRLLSHSVTFLTSRPPPRKKNTLV